MILGIFRSRLGIILAALYLSVAAVVIYHVYGCMRQGFLPCDLPLGLVILPAIPLLLLLNYIGVRESSFTSPGPYVERAYCLLIKRGKKLGP